MGEVYRADDLKLGQPVALKFLPRALASDPVRRERFFAEVRITRQLAHPNICRVYDIAEFEGQQFLSMEYIDGEDLASLINRIGYLSNEKALEIARQLATGLAAAHDRGVLHRDLKPANIMIDGRGRVRITDFGLAVLLDDSSETAQMMGTPAYMAPEQLAGKAATVRSDIYAFGLVLYEIYCGRQAFNARSLAELREQKESRTPDAPSEIRQDVDPVVERVVMRCIERDPHSRPASAAQIAAALPGGDPLAAALAAGETPSPELVAASGGREGMRPTLALGLLAVVIVGAVGTVLFSDRMMLFNRVNPQKAPAALVERAQEHIRKAGYTATPADTAFGFDYTPGFLGGNPANLPDSLGLVFWYRQSPQLIERPAVPFGSVSPDNPPIYFSGEVLTVLDSEGRLLGLRAIPPPLKSAAESTPVPDWATLFASAGLDISQWTPSPPRWNPDSYADAQIAWQGSLPSAPGIPVRIEAAAYQGRPVSFQVVYPGTQPDRIPPATPPFSQKIGAAIGLATLFVVVGAAVFFARNNLRLGRGDRRGAIRLMLVVQALLALTWAFSEHHVLAFWESALLLVQAGIILLIGAALGVLYLAFEPYVRRRWPQMFISWTRLFSGEWRDPLLGRDLLGGCAAGVVLACLTLVQQFLTTSGRPFTVVLDGVNGPVAGRVAFMAVVGAFFSLATLLAFVLLRSLLRNTWLAVAVFGVVRTMPVFFAAQWTSTPLYFVIQIFPLLIFTQFGLLGGVTAGIVYGLFISPITFHASSWYANSGFMLLALIAALSLFAFRTAIGKRQPIDLSAD
jgi:serine/threonine-protein kinase